MRNEQGTSFPGSKGGACCKQLTGVFLFCFLLLSTITVRAGEYSYPEDYYIEHYQVEMMVDEGNVYQITEILTVQFNEDRHGIMRDIPREMYGYRHRITGFQVDNPDTGKSYPLKRTTSGDMITLRIGDPNSTVRGRVRYRIRYKFVMGDDREPDFDEIYFNLIGTGWDTSIAQVALSVEMPKSFDPLDIRLFTGAPGSTDQTRFEWETIGNTIQARSVGALLPGEGVTMRLILPEGYFTEVKTPLLLPYVLLVMAMHLAALVLAIAYRSKHSNAHKIVPVLTFDPPDGINPAEAAYAFKDESVNNRDMASLILHWASKGFLRIEEQEKALFRRRDSLVFYMLVNSPGQASSYEKTMFRRFFACGSQGIVTTGDLSERLYQDLSNAITGVKSKYKKDKEILVNRYQSLTVWGSIGLYFMTVFTSALVLNLVLGGHTYGPALLACALLHGGNVVAWLMMNHQQRVGISIGSLLRSTPVLLGWILITWVAIMAATENQTHLYLRADLLPMLGVPVLSIMAMLTLVHTKVYTPYAIDLLCRLRGFRNFLLTVKRDRLQMMFQQNPSWFYDVLPYAMVFGLTRIWERHMKVLTLPPPSWYNSPYGYHPGWSSGFMHGINRTVSSAVSTPSSSSSGGGSGGSSGGGGGGGGGSSW